MKKSITDFFVSNETNPLLLGLLAFIFAFAVTTFLMPKIILFVRQKGLMDKPNFRSSHQVVVPTLGGVAFYITFMLSMFLMVSVDSDSTAYFLIPAISVLFITGLKDDLCNLSAIQKIIGEVFAITIVLINLSLTDLSLYGLFGTEPISYILSIPLIYFFFLFITNAFNLIDGIDGLASLIGIFIFSVLGTFFYMADAEFNYILSILAVGTLISFLIFNLSRKNKIFMGDTGSLIIGFLIAYQSFAFISLSQEQLMASVILPGNLFYVLFALLFLPILDVIRVSFLRISRNRSPFEADRNHMHHVLIDKGFSHVGASVTLTLIGIFVFSTTFLLNLNSNFSLFWVLMVFSVIFLQTFKILSDTNDLISFRQLIISLFQKLLVNIYRQIKNGTAIVFRTFF